MLKQLIILRGLPGSGKSKVAEDYKKKHHDSCIIISTDNYWYRPDGLYDFKYDLLGRAHEWTKQKAKMTMEFESKHYNNYDSVIIIDNTNMSFQEMKPYILMGLKYKFEIKFEEPKTAWRYDVISCHLRQDKNISLPTMYGFVKHFEPEEVVLEKFRKLVINENY